MRLARPFVNGSTQVVDTATSQMEAAKQVDAPINSSITPEVDTEFPPRRQSIEFESMDGEERLRLCVPVTGQREPSTEFGLRLAEDRSV
jgi:hypothetical protein